MRLRLPLSETELGLLERLISEREDQVRVELRKELNDHKADVIRRGVDRSSMGDRVRFAELAQGLTILQRLEIPELVDRVLECAGKQWTRCLADAVVEEVSQIGRARMDALLRSLEQQVESAWAMLPSVDKAKQAGERAVNRIEFELRRALDIRVGIAEISCMRTPEDDGRDQSVVDVFVSYSHANHRQMTALKRHLRPLEREGLLRLGCDLEITAGKDIDQEILKRLQSAGIVLLLVSSDFIDSEYCYSVELQTAIDRHMGGQARVIPVILRPCDWHNQPFGKLMALPTDGKPVAGRDWKNQDEGLADVARGIRRVVHEMRQ